MPTFTSISIVVIGAGAYGTALAIALSRNGHKILLWGRNAGHIQILKKTRCNQFFLPNISFPPSLYLEESLSVALSTCNDILIVVPSYAFSSILMQLKPYLRSSNRIIWATKGLEIGTGRLLHEVARDILGEQIPLAVISGPTFARELANNLPTAITVAASDITFCTDLQQLLHSDKNFRIYSNSDFIGIQLGGVVKNIIAIGAGISDGMGFGANARTALITRGFVEMSRLGIAMGAKLSTFMGMAGLGDLVLTCTDNQSRNRQFGVLLGKGFNIQEARRMTNQIVEGLYNVNEIRMLANRYNVEMPITEQIYHILYENKNVHEAALALLGRTQKDEQF